MLRPRFTGPSDAFEQGAQHFSRQVSGSTRQQQNSDTLGGFKLLARHRQAMTAPLKNTQELSSLSQKSKCDRVLLVCDVHLVRLATYMAFTQHESFCLSCNLFASSSDRRCRVKQ